ncbi:MAG: polysaccharide deacetylase family protein [Kiritimatiellae bacterium]|nr:polysaccharide deacetylase family protein [Kiritimatiellia bacterium]
MVLGFDTEADVFEKQPYGKAAMRKVIASLETIGRHLDDFDAPATFFLVGQLVEAAPDAFRRVLANPRYEIASHTYSHMGFKSIGTWTCPHSVADVKRDIRQSLVVLKRVFGAESVQGVCAPGNYWRGIQDRADLQRMLIGLGLEYVCSDGRGPADTIPAPFTQPYWYVKGKLLEVAHTGWHCNMLNCLMGDRTLWPPLPSTRLPPKKVETVREQIQGYRHEFNYTDTHSLFYAPTMHPWSLYRFDPQVRALRAMLRWARERGVPVMTYAQVSDRFYKRVKRNNQ